MALQQSIPILLRYGSGREFACELDASRVSVFRPGVQPRADVVDVVNRALASPLDLPTLDQALVPDDRVLIALDRGMPCSDTIIAGIWPYLELRGIDPGKVTVLQPAGIDGKTPPDPRSSLPSEVRDTVHWQIHDPTAENSCAYLATSSSGERIHLAREIVDADFVLPVGVTAFDSLLGYRGTASVLYPGLSTLDAIRKTVGQGHIELSPRDQRPLRQLVDEIAWLMGIQFSVQVVAAEAGGICDVIAGSNDAVFNRSRELLDDNWMIAMPERVDTVVVAVSEDVEGHSWSQIGRAVATARQLVESGGRIVVLSELKDAPGEGLRLLRNADEPMDAMQLLRAETPPDLIPATQLATAANWARLLMLSELDGTTVEDLFMYPLESLSEVERILDASDSCALIGAAQHTFGIVD